MNILIIFRIEIWCLAPKLGKLSHFRTGTKYYDPPKEILKRMRALEDEILGDMDALEKMLS